jgi:drug/metabolite transporter (DMT)-like permease
MGVVYGLMTAIGWGTGDFLLSRVSRQIGLRQALLWAQLLGIGAIGLVLLVSGDPLPTDLRIWLLAVVVNIFNVAGTVLLYRALTIGTLAIVSPITASFAVVTTALAVAGGERPEPLAFGGALLVVAGVIVVSRAGTDGRAASLRGVGAAMGAALCYGIFFWMLVPVSAGMGIAWPVLVGRVLAVLTALVMLGLARERPCLPPRSTWSALTMAVMFDTGAFLSYNLGIATAYVSVVAALASIFSAVTVILAWLILRERLASLQWAGVAAVIVGVLLVSV